MRELRCYFDLNADEPRPPLDSADLARLETLLGVRLPTALVALLRVRNGGTLRLSRFRRRGGGSGDVVTVGTLAGVSVGGGVHDLFRVPYLRGEWEVPEWAVMLSGDGHSWVALDYRESVEPAVVYLDESDDGFAVVELAPSFEAFLDGLELEEGQTCWGSQAPTGIVLDAIRSQHGLRLSDRFEATVFAASTQASWRVRLRSNRGHRDELVWPEFPAIRAILECDIDADQRIDAVRWISALGIPFELLHDPAA
ncbi:MAG: SMI1/KNR4 family protein [Deltaproteobacteria bacterium]|nr:SMI1/KNR4 family protein [Kofleriaceae bacterium]